MLKNLDIHDFRGFHRFRIPRLGRVNLLVGTNNCGKTSILEAVDILTSSGDMSAVRSALMRRGEDLGSRSRPLTDDLHDPRIDIKHLFRGHSLGLDGSFEIRADTDDGGKHSVVVSVRQTDGQATLFDADLSPTLYLWISWWNGRAKDVEISIDRQGGIRPRKLIRHPLFDEPGPPTRFVTAASLSPESTVSLFQGIVLTEAEDLVVESLKFIDSSIERIAAGGGRGSGRRTKGGLMIRMQGQKDPVPIGSMGDGIWRMLGLALSVVGTRGGVLLVDEIDTGLHYTVMRDMWRFLYQCAKKYDVQVVATTHSWDCCRALAAICREDVSEESDVTISRIEKGREEAVTYTEQEIVAVAERDIEVR